MSPFAPFAVVEFLQHLLPDKAPLQLNAWHLDQVNHRLILTVSAVGKLAHCPLCQQPTRRVHSRYERTLQDLPCVNYAVTLLLRVRKFFCDNPGCQRRIFTERLPQVMRSWARHTCRLAERLVTVGLALGGAAGARLSQQLGYRMTIHPLLRLIARLPLPPITSPHTLGVDDFAFRKGQHYGTILVDLDRHRPLALLKDREADTLADWLQQHPGIQILSRDRSKTYKQGMAKGAPDAIQVADRFHLLQNLADVLERFLASQSAALKAVDLAHHQVSNSQSQVPSPSEQEKRAKQRREQRFARYEQVHHLRQQGLSVPDIAHHLAMGERTVFRFLSCPQFPEWQPHPRHARPRAIDPYKPYLIEQWNQGQRQTKQLFAQVQQQGYRGSYQTVARYTRQLRQAQRQQLNDQTGRGPAPPIMPTAQPPLSARRATWLLLKPPHQQSVEDEALVTRLIQHPDLTAAIHLAQDFADLVRQQEPEQLDRWLAQAHSSVLKQFQSFAKGLQEDYAAVKAGIALEVSNGQVEGQINRLKMIKRQMYGRAGFDLLQRRVLLAG